MLYSFLVEIITVADDVAKVIPDRMRIYQEIIPILLSVNKIRLIGNNPPVPIICPR